MPHSQSTSLVSILSGAIFSITATAQTYPFEMGKLFVFGLIGGFGGYVGKLIAHNIWQKIQKIKK